MSWRASRSGEEEPAPAEYRTALRDVVRNCIYAVDKNPLAVDLCKVALWIESHAAGFPLSFLDHHIKCGDSLVGIMDIGVLQTGIPDDAYTAVTGDDKKAATQYRNRNRLERKGQTALPTLQKAADEMAAEWADFTDLEERSPSEVKAKEDLYQVLREFGHSLVATEGCLRPVDLRLFRSSATPDIRSSRRRAYHRQRPASLGQPKHPTPNGGISHCCLANQRILPLVP